MIVKFFTILLLTAALILALPVLAVHAQEPSSEISGSSARFIDQIVGMTADQAVAKALENNGEIQALRKEVEAASALVKQAGLRANPKLEAGGSRQIGGPDNNAMVGGMLPLELGGRRGARIKVAQAELEIRESALANQERLLAAEVRAKFGETLAQIKKLDLIENLLKVTRQGYDLIAAKVAEGRTPPLEQNMFLVELNRQRSLREIAEGKVEASVFELRNMIGMQPSEPLKLSGNFENLLAQLPAIETAVSEALRGRPDLRGARAMENLAVARIDQSRADGRIDASIKTGYQRMNFSFPVNGFDDNGTLRPVQSIFHFFTFGVELDFPVRNRNQGAIAAAKLDQEAAQRRTEFGELTIKREVNVAIARYNRAFRSLSIFKNGVRDQANANLQVIWQTYELGQKTLSDYIAEQRRFLEIENELIDAELEAYSANIDILRATNSPGLTKR